MKVNILIVDDHQSNLDTLHFLIDDIEFDNEIQVEVLEATNGNDALAFAMKYDIALIILDIQMPVMDGFEVAKFLKKSSKTKEIPIAFLTAAFKSEDMREYGLHLGAFDYFLKPIDSLILVPKIKLYVHFYAITNELKHNNEILEQKVKEAVEKNSQMESKLFQAEKLSSMGEMMGNIAHQWRQPLSVISTAATGAMAQKEYGLLTDELFYSSMKNIDETAQYLSKTIESFKEFLKDDKEDKINFNLSEVINKALEINSELLKLNDIETILYLDDTITLENLPNSLIDVLLNIIHNAKDALSTTTNKKVFIETQRVDDTITIFVKDNAGGIKDDIIEKVFEPYFTTKHQSQGTGLGLHMVYKIVCEKMQGDIEVYNEEFTHLNQQQKGAVFKITLGI
jgi:C4-dicarboxylate-specific signal transduction histidine kinase